MVIRLGLYDDTLRIWDSASGISACMPALVGSLPDVSFFFVGKGEGASKRAREPSPPYSNFFSTPPSLFKFVTPPPLPIQICYRPPTLPIEFVRYPPYPRSNLLGTPATSLFNFVTI